MSHSPRSRLGPSLRRLVAGSVLAFAGCGKDGAPAGITPEIVRARDLAADHGYRGKEGWRRAVEILEPLVEDEDAPLEDLLRMACAQLAIKEGDPMYRRPEDRVKIW